MENYKVSPKFLEGTIKFGGKSLVGKICKRIELLQQNKDPYRNIKSEEKLEIIKDLVKEIIYEELRNIKYSIIYYNKGTVKGYNEELINYNGQEEPPIDSKKE